MDGGDDTPFRAFGGGGQSGMTQTSETGRDKKKYTDVDRGLESFQGLFTRAYVKNQSLQSNFATGSAEGPRVVFGNGGPGNYNSHVVYAVSVCCWERG
eukprot:2051268-Amphidinium_carterae.1